MKELLKQWVGQHAQLPGVLACGVRFPDKTSFTQSWAADFRVQSLERAWRSSGEAFQVLKIYFFPTDYVRWVYEKAVLHCARRDDGICLGIFTAKGEQSPDPAAVQRLLVEFRALRSETS
jgi:hypothetical protein